MATPVHATTAAGVTTLTLDSPANRNALSAELVAELRAAFAAAGADPAVRAVVLTHTGGTFCSGADLKSPFDPADFVALLREIAELAKPVVARVTGHVRAGGLGLLGVCDITAAGPQSSYAFTETHLGVVPAVISAPLLPRLDPRGAARYFLTAEAFDAAEAARIGLLTLHGDDVDEILAPVLAGLRKAGPQALAATRRLVTAPVRAALAQDGIALTELSARHFASAEAREGITARFERRDPSWAL
ncbi:MULTISPECIES: enoyl-CoA hydratase family protein [unclassified Streptomyces]|uniref:enoyl-CoA hydratase family protein n=1 Tax=unclassified Streptomyces TaxID=2593676 RepID=UPI0006AF0862|nr:MULTISPECIES: enoyl-CoA hydratase family protein [unclassified Streptomyces]KOV16082.1 enoyl-CoA hydratase [Streptomyces sp. XY511]RSS86968.1 enoyl-CoA hydratase family protein [Streptomyces sp. WAC05950]